MKRLDIILLLATFPFAAFAQSMDNAPASREDVERYLQVANSQDMVKKLMGTITQSMQQLNHQQCQRHKNEVPANCESKLNAVTDDLLNKMPIDEMMQATIPAYQKHLTKGDVDNLVAFYATPTGQKLLREMPSMLADAMQDMMPVMNKYMETVQSRIQKETDAMIAQSKKSANSSSASHD
jgi:uncharacterized protein